MTVLRGLTYRNSLLRGKLYTEDEEKKNKIWMVSQTRRVGGWKDLGLNLEPSEMDW